jgi:general secretion pathway protein K
MHKVNHLATALVRQAGRAEAMRLGSEEGVALVAVLWVLALLSVIAASLSLETRTDARIARNSIDRAAAQAAADAGIDRVILDLISPETEKKFRVDGTSYYWRFAGSDVRISVRDESDKVNINTAPAALLASWFASVGFDPNSAQSLADRIADFRDSDNLRHSHGAEENEYRAAGLRWGPKNSPFEAVEELQQVLGMTEGIYDRVAPQMTVYSVGAPISPSAAGKQLAAVLRQAGGTNLLVLPGRIYSIRSEAFRSHGSIFVREAVVERRSSTSPRVLSWQQGGAQKLQGYIAAMQGNG